MKNKYPEIPELLKKFHEALDKADWAKAKDLLSRMKNLIKLPKHMIHEAAVWAAESALKVALMQAGVDAASAQKVTEMVHDIADEVDEYTPPGPWAELAKWVIILVIICLFLKQSAGAEEMPDKQGEKQPEKKGGKGSEGLGIPKEVEKDPTINPAAELQQQIARKYAQYKEERQKHCRCARQRMKQAYAPLGSGFAGQDLAFAPIPGGLPPLGQQNGPGGGAQGKGPAGKTTSTGNGGGGGGGRPDPLSFPQKGGKQLPQPGKTGKEAPTLPDVKPPSVCMWPVCLSINGGGARQGAG